MSHQPRSRFVRSILGVLALGVASAFVVPVPGCAAPFDPPSLVNSLRVLTVVADKPYANPGDTVSLKMSFYDGLGALEESGPRPIQITWLGGCFNPIGDQYYGCYAPLGELLQKIAEGGAPPAGLVTQGVNLDTFELTIPDDILASRPIPETGVRYGLAYVFFTACAGTIRPVAPEGSSDAGSFPLGCFDENGTRLGPESFVPGYTQVYVFEDGRQNANPTLSGLTLDGDSLPEDFAAIPTVSRCAVSAEERRVSGCGAEDPLTSCTTYKLDIDVPTDVAEVDPDAVSADGGTLREAVWVDYFADRGDIQTDIKLVSDAVKGYVPGHETEWIPPDEPGLVTFWAVLRDARGGSTVMQRFVRVE